MKKYMGNYTNEAAKALKGSERIICRVTDDGAIYVTNGFIAYKMNPPEYAAIVQPVTCCEAGNYTMQNGEKAADNGFDLVKLFNETVEQTANAPALERCPLTLQAGKAPAASYYNPAAGVASFYNAKFIAALTPSATLRATGAISAAVAYVGGEPLALVLPIKPEPKAAGPSRHTLPSVTTAPPPRPTNSAPSWPRHKTSFPLCAAIFTGPLTKSPSWKPSRPRPPPSSPNPKPPPN